MERKAVGGRSSSAVWMADLTVSAGYSARTQRAPERAPERADSHGARVRSSGLGKEEEEGLELWVKGR